MPPNDAWQAALPELVDRYSREWKLQLGKPYTGGSAGFAAPATRADGTAAVFKASMPDREARYEASALQWWDGHGAVRLLEHDQDDFVLLVERCDPGVRLDDQHSLSAEDRLEIAARLLVALWETGIPESSPYERVGDVTAEWADLAARRMETIKPPYDAGLVDHGVELLRTLPRSATREVIVHGDFNPGNILSATRSPWLVIDPKPMVGDPGYDLCPLLLQVDHPFRHDDPAAVLSHRYELVAAIVGEPADRLIAWSVARSVEAALWYANRSEIPAGAGSMAEAATLAGLLG